MFDLIQQKIASGSAFWSFSGSFVTFNLVVNFKFKFANFCKIVGSEI